MNKFIARKFILISLSIASFSISNITLAFDNFQESLNYANSVRGTVQDAVSKFNPQQEFGKDYNPNPDQGKYFNGVTQFDDNNLKNDAAKGVNRDTYGKAINDSAKNRPIYHVDDNSTAMQKSKLIQSDSYNISHGISDKYVDCSKAKNCHTVDIKKNCNEVTRYVPRNCTLKPKVTIVDQPYTEAQHYDGSIFPNSNNSGTFWLPVNGTITDFNVTLKASDNIWKCKVNYNGYVQGGYLSTYNNGCGDGLSDLSFTNYGLDVQVSNSQPVSFYFTGGPSYGQWARANYSLNITAELHRKVAKVEWVENCNGDLDGNICTDKDKICTEPGGTRYFDSIPVTLDCWNYSITQQCTAKSDNNCQPLRDQGCSQIGSVCRVKLDDTCVVQDETYGCPVEKCDPTDGIVCGGDFFCMNGDCSSHDPTYNQNYGKDISELAAIGSAAKDVMDQNSQDPHVFTGEAMECSIDIASSRDCCKDSGWGKGILNCSDDEKKLGLAKESNLVVAAGDNGNNKYCHNKVPDTGVCLDFHKVYCVFPSKLARIVQEQGRKGQLGVNFGYVDDDSAHPNCRGLTPDELQRIDFSKIDFHEIVDDIKNNVHYPSTGDTENTIKQHVQDFYDKHKKHN